MKVLNELPARNTQTVRRLLLVESNALLGRALVRFFRRYFDDVVSVEGKEHVARLLQDNLHLPTHMICGAPFADDSTGVTPDFANWRTQCPSLTCVLIVTGCEQMETMPSGVDAILRKPIAPEALVPFLFARSR